MSNRFKQVFHNLFYFILRDTSKYIRREDGVNNSYGSLFLSASFLFKDWLRPMLQRIAENPMAVVTPVIDRVDETTFKYWTFSGPTINIGIFQWDLTFNWGPVYGERRNAINSPVDPIK